MQLCHKASIAATDAFWKVALKFEELFEAKENLQNVKISQFRTYREKMYKKQCPKILLTFVYKNNQSGDVQIIDEVESAPRSAFDNNSKYTKLYEIAHVQVKILYL